MQYAAVHVVRNPTTLAGSLRGRDGRTTMKVAIAKAITLMHSTTVEENIIQIIAVVSIFAFASFYLLLGLAGNAQL